MNGQLEALLAMYRERHAELERVMAARESVENDRIFAKRCEQVEYLFGCLDGLRAAINLLDPKLWAGCRWRDFSTWEASLTPLATAGGPR